MLSPTGNRGADIASQRLDKLDRAALLELAHRDAIHTTCIELGCGLGAQGLRLAKLGADTWLYDVLPESSELKAVRREQTARLHFCQTDIRALKGKALPQRINLVFSQRFIHYLEWEEAGRLVELIHSRMERGTHFYLSASGLHSELGQDYADADKPVQMRFCRLEPTMQAKHAIHAPVCLYTRDDLSQLMESHGFSTIKAWTSEFGNIKGIFRSHDRP